jgi:hypothetical protein
MLAVVANQASDSSAMSLDVKTHIGYILAIMQTISDYIPDFTPVPLARQRHDGWTAEKQRQFLILLAATGTVASAVQAVGMTRVSAYNLCKRPGAESFAREWDLALSHGRARMIDHAMERAINGVTTIRLRLGGVVDLEHGPDRRMIRRALREPPPPRPAAPPNFP